MLVATDAPAAYALGIGNIRRRLPGIADPFHDRTWASIRFDVLMFNPDRIHDLVRGPAFLVWVCDQDCRDAIMPRVLDRSQVFNFGFKLPDPQLIRMTRINHISFDPGVFCLKRLDPQIHMTRIIPELGILDAKLSDPSLQTIRIICSGFQISLKLGNVFDRRSLLCREGCIKLLDRPMQTIRINRISFEPGVFRLKLGNLLQMIRINRISFELGIFGFKVRDPFVPPFRPCGFEFVVFLAKLLDHSIEQRPPLTPIVPLDRKQRVGVGKLFELMEPIRFADLEELQPVQHIDAVRAAEFDHRVARGIPRSFVRIEQADKDFVQTLQPGRVHAASKHTPDGAASIKRRGARTPLVTGWAVTFYHVSVSGRLAPKHGPVLGLCAACNKPQATEA
jgi:hypothetical protein